LLTALAVAYQVQCRLSDVAPVRAKGFDHTTQGAYAVLQLELRKRWAWTRSKSQMPWRSAAQPTMPARHPYGRLSNWKGLAYPNTVFGATHATFLAMRGITGPLEVFEGNKGFMDAIAGHFELDWQGENLEAVRHTSVKKYNAEFHSQSAWRAFWNSRNFTSAARGDRAHQDRHL
jgi:2-methylcitrate dehydratase